MWNVVKLILICQIKDDRIPQLIPLIWIISVFIVSLLLIVIIDLFFYSIIENIHIKLYSEIIINKSYLW